MGNEAVPADEGYKRLSHFQSQQHAENDGETLKKKVSQASEKN